VNINVFEQIINLMFAILKCYNIHRIYNRASLITQQFLFIYIKVVYRQGDMFRPPMGHLQALRPEDDPLKVETCRPDDILLLCI
jgi:hypothetical protein